MNRIVTALFVVIIALGSLTGIRYLGSVIHFACANPLEDCAPPIHGVGEIFWYVTGGSLLPWQPQAAPRDVSVDQ